MGKWWACLISSDYMSIHDMDVAPALHLRMVGNGAPVVSGGRQLARWATWLCYTLPVLRKNNIYPLSRTFRCLTQPYINVGGIRVLDLKSQGNELETCVLWKWENFVFIFKNCVCIFLISGLSQSIKSFSGVGVNVSLPFFFITCYLLCLRSLGMCSW